MFLIKQLNKCYLLNVFHIIKDMMDYRNNKSNIFLFNGQSRIVGNVSEY